MGQLQDELSRNTKISIGLLISFLTLAFWMGIAWADLQSIKRRVSLMESIDQRLSRIEGKLGIESR